VTTFVTVPAESPDTNPIDLPRYQHPPIERAVDAVTDALCALAQGFLSRAVGDDAEYTLASDVVRRAHAITGDMRRLALLQTSRGPQ
jgi:hypothetical protein